MHRSVFAVIVAVLSVLLISATQVEAQEGHPIMMDRREAAPFGDILTELKGKGLGGRMRFGKRSFSPMRYAYEPLEMRDLYPIQ
ncbi:unnamed protein product [Caenorhabditis auriculariae]|uniref:Uncharacterized protein n=1 Tax=Caenorhabditis auriculariae TaxID=2777116 RepID=A0A8S1HRD8_9PELO|nr:unnamed protein product [Caenorhabditis auriculariae]